MTRTMIEIVARALAEADGVNPDWSATGMGMPGPEDNEPGWKLYEDDARTAIMAMREPTQFMIDAGNSVAHEEAPSTYYEAMIEAALKEEPAP